MIVHVTDSQLVGETLSTLFSTIQQGPVNMMVVLKNSGVNMMSYRFQEYNGTAWVDLGASGSDYYNYLGVNEVKLIKVVSNYPQVQMVGNASGGSFVEFAVTRYCNRASGGSIPILNL
jgi:hypothetical protein